MEGSDRALILGRDGGMSWKLKEKEIPIIESLEKMIFSRKIKLIGNSSDVGYLELLIRGHVNLILMEMWRQRPKDESEMMGRRPRDESKWWYCAGLLQNPLVGPSGECDPEV